MAVVSESAKALGITGPYPQAQYVQYMERAFGRDGARFLDAVDKWLTEGGRPEGAAALYRSLARKPAMAAYVTSHQYSAFYVALGKTLADSNLLVDQEVIDFGCGFGLFPQLLARMYPASRVVGYDRAEIIAAARKVIRGAVPHNLSFCDDLGSVSAESRNPVVLMACVTHELFPLALAGANDPSEGGSDLGRHLSRLVGDEGLLVTVNRFPYPARQLPRLDAIFAHCGLIELDVGLPPELEIVEAGRISRLPIRTYGRHVAN